MAKNKLSKLIFLIGIIFSVFFSVYVFKIEYDSNQAENFSKSLFELISNLILIVFIIYIIYLRFFKYKENERVPIKFIIIGFLSVFILIIMTNYLVNPRGIYGPSIFPTLVTNLRNKKVNNYENLKESPDILIIGSSRALSINPDYIEEKTGLSSYNFAVTGTFLDEYLVILKYIYDNDKFDPPKVILIDRLGFSVGYGRTAFRAPFQFFPYIEKENQSEIIVNRISEITSLHQLTESFYVLKFFLLNQDYQTAWTVSNNGFGSLHLEKNLSQSIEDLLTDKVDRSPCHNFSPKDSIPILEEIVSLASQNNSIIIFYNSPSHPDYLSGLEEQQKYQTSILDVEINCEQVIANFYTQLDEMNPYVHSIEFSSPEDFSGFVDERGFHDGFHMTELNNNLLIDALSEEIINAYQESIQRRDILIKP